MCDVCPVCPDPPEGAFLFLFVSSSSSSSIRFFFFNSSSSGSFFTSIRMYVSETGRRDVTRRACMHACMGTTRRRRPDDPTTTDVSVRRGVPFVCSSVRLFVCSFIRPSVRLTRSVEVYPYGDASRRVLGVGSVLGEVYPGARGGEEDGGGERTRRRTRRLRTRRRVKKYEVGAENGSRDGERR